MKRSARRIEHGEEEAGEGYAYRARKYIIPALGDIKLKDLTAEHLDGLYEQKSACGL